MKNTCLVFCLAVAVFAVHPVGASLIGDTVTINCVAQLPSPDSDCLLGGGPANVVVDNGEEGAVSSPTSDIAIDIEAESIVLAPIGVPTLVPTTDLLDFGGLSQTIEFSSLDWVGAPNGIIVGVSIVIDGPLSNALGPIAFTDHSVTFDFGDSIWAEETVVTINIATDHLAAVPEPATAALLGSGLLALLIRRRRAGN